MAQKGSNRRGLGTAKRSYILAYLRRVKERTELDLGGVFRIAKTRQDKTESRIKEKCSQGQLSIRWHIDGR